MKLLVRSLVWLPVLCVSFASCGDDANKNVSRAEGGEGGGGTEPSAGGTEVNPGTGGAGGAPEPVTAGTGGTGEGGVAPVPAVGGAGGAGGEGVAELVCFQPAPGAGGFGGDPYGGAQWKDFAANACRPCPAADVICDDLVLDPAATYDSESGVLTLQLGPGKSEIVGADFTWRYFDGQTNVEETVAAVVDQNTLTLQVGPVASEPGYIWGELTVRDGCGDEKLIGDNEDWFVLGKLDPGTGGAGGEPPVPYEIRCDYD